MATNVSGEYPVKATIALRTTDPLVHEFARRLGTVDFDSIEGHLRSLEQTADERGFLSLDPDPGCPPEIEYSTARLVADCVTPQTQVGPYLLGRLLGVGGFSRVFEAFHEDRPAERVALKLFQHRWLDALERLEIERLVLQELNHPNLVQAIDSGETEDGLSYLVLAFVSGQRIDEFVRSRELDPREIAGLFAQVADALAYAHGQDVVHRDLKPSNILVSDDGLPVVADFGLAKRLRLPRGQSVTISGALVGTLGYLAPEQVHGGKGEITRAVDVYGLGATLYAVLTGRPPTDSENLLRGLHQLQQGRPPTPRSLNPNVPLELQLICLKCLETLPHDRYGSMEELAADLRRFAAGQRVAARAPSMRSELWRWARANPTVASLAGGILTAIAAGLVVSVMFWQRAETRRLQADALLRSAHMILKEGNRIAEDSLEQTAGSLEYRYKRLRQSIDFLNALLVQFPEDSELRYEQAVANFLLGKVCARRGMSRESLESYNAAESVFRAMLAESPGDLKLKFDIFHAVLGKYHVNEISGYNESNTELLLEAHQLVREILTADPKNTTYRDAYVCTLMQLPGRCTLPGDVEIRLELHQLAHAEALKLRNDLPEPSLGWRYVGLTASHVAIDLRVLGRYEEAAVWIQKGLAYQQEYLELASRDPLEKLDWIGLRQQEIELAVELGEVERARQIYADTVKWTGAYREQYPDYFDFQRYFNGLIGWSAEYPELVGGTENLPAQTAD